MGVALAARRLIAPRDYLERAVVGPKFEKPVMDATIDGCEVGSPSPICA
jgi:hypothetical protein